MSGYERLLGLVATSRRRRAKLTPQPAPLVLSGAMFRLKQLERHSCVQEFIDQEQWLGPMTGTKLHRHYGLWSENNHRVQLPYHIFMNSLRFLVFVGSLHKDEPIPGLSAGGFRKG